MKRQNILKRLLCAILIPCCLAVSLTACSSAETVRKKTISIAYADGADEGEVMLICNEKVASTVIDDGDAGISVQESADGSCLAFLNADALFVTDGSKATRIAEGVRTFVLSGRGKAIAYTDEENALYLYDIGKDVSTKIDSSVYLSSASNYVLSPDGSAVLYNKEADEYQELWLYTKGEKNKLTRGDLGRGPYPIAVSADGKLCYAASLDALYSFDGEKNKNKISGLGGSYLYYGFRCYLNSDCTDLLFYYDGGTYLSIDGGEKTMISKDAYFPLLDDDCVTISSVSGAFYTEYEPIDSFANRFYCGYSDDGYYLAYVDKSYELDKIASGVEYSKLTDDDHVFYSKKHSLYRVSDSDYDDPVEIADDVAYDGFVAANKNSAYFLDTDGSLRYYNGKKLTKISDDVEDLAYFERYGGIIYETDGMLYFAKKDKKEKIASEFYAWGVNGSVAYYLSGDWREANLYVSTGASFKLLLKNCSFLSLFRNF